MELLKVFMLSITPISELRGAIPYGVKLGLSPETATAVAIFGNIILIPILILIIKPLFDYLKTFKYLKEWVNKYEKRAANKLQNYRKYRFWGLVLLVGIPIPTTGVYTGVVASQVMHMKVKTALVANIIGVLMSGTIVYLMTRGYLAL